MAEIRDTTSQPQPHHPADKSEQFWSKNSKSFIYGLVGILAIVGGYLVYDSYFKAPKQKESEEAIFKAEAYYRMDSLDKALNGDGVNVGLIRVISRYDGTKAGERAKFMAGSIYLRKGDFKNAIKYLEDFDTDAPQIQARAYALLADAYSESATANNNNSNKEKAAGLYMKAANTFDKDDVNASEYLFRAGYLNESLGKNKEAIEAYKSLKEKYPQTQRGFEVDKYLARLGEIK